MAKKITQKSLKHDEFVEAGLDVGQWIEEHWKPIAGGVGGILVLGLLWIGWHAWSDHQAKEAGRLLGQGLALLQPEPRGDAPAAPSDPAAAATKFEEAADAAGGSALGSVARFYRAAALLEAGRAADAVPILEALVGKSTPGILAGSTEALLADALERMGEPERAASVLERLAAAPDGAYPPAIALVSLGEFRLRQGRREDARQVFEDVLARFPESAAAAQARGHLTELGSGLVDQ